MPNKKIIYIVDDEEYNRDIAARLVKKMGHSSRLFENGQACLEAIEEQIPDMLLLDIHMPRMNGLEVLKQLREQIDKTKLPILMITADSDSDSVVTAFENGANDYATKPINSKTLRSRIETHMQLHEATQQIREFAEGAERVVGDYTIDLQNRNEELAREVRLRMDTESDLLDKKLYAERASREKTEFIAAMSQEMSTPLKIGLGFAQIIAHDKNQQVSPEQCREYAAYISKSSAQLLNIVSDVMAIASYDTGTSTLLEGNAELEIILNDAIETSTPHYTEKNISLQLNCTNGLELQCDQIQLSNALSRIISNAIRTSNNDSHLQITSRLLDSFDLEVIIQSQGIAIPGGDIEKMTHPFKRATQDKDKDMDGLGLGIPAAQAILDMHNTTLDAVSDPNTGHKLTIRFPAERVVLFPEEKADSSPSHQLQQMKN